MNLRVAGAQIEVTGDIERNVKTLSGAIQKAKMMHADILLSPEGSLSGYTHLFDQAQLTDALDYVVAQAKDARLALALGTCFVEDDGLCYNQVRFYDADGTYLGFHSKILRCGSMTDPPRGELEHYFCSPLRTFLIKGIPVGALICNDLWANPGCTPMPDPHLTHELAKMGARIIFHAVNGGRDGSPWSTDIAWPYHEMNLRMRAQASKIWIVTVDNCSPLHHPCSAPSGVVTPEGSWAVQASRQGEDLFFHILEVSARVDHES